MINDYINKSPARIDIENCLKKYLPAIQGTILEIGSKNRRYDNLLQSTPTAIDIIPNKRLNVEYGDINDLRFENSTFDNIICFEVLEYSDSPTKAISEVIRVLRKNGTLLMSVPFMFKIHGDKLRYTKDYLYSNLLVDFHSVKVIKLGNAYSIILTIIRDKINKVKYRAIRYIGFTIYAMLVIFLPFSNKIARDQDYATGYFIIAQK